MTMALSSRKTSNHCLKTLSYIKPTCTSIKNPQSNAILERVHQVTGSMLKTKDVANKIFDALDPWMESLSSIFFAVRCSYHSTLGATPGQLVFGPDMLLNISFKSNYRKYGNQNKSESIMRTFVKIPKIYLTITR